MFGHAVRAYFADAFAKHGALLDSLGVDPNNGLGTVLAKVATLPQPQRETVERDFAACYETGPNLAMVDSARGVTNLHSPSDIIIDASMPNVVRDAGAMWNKDNKLQESKCLIPDRSYATMYGETIDFCIQHGQFDPAVRARGARQASFLFVASSVILVAAAACCLRSLACCLRSLVALSVGKPLTAVAAMRCLCARR
jgi:monomeric type NADP-dependent isocitrate dehydrogenase